MFSFLSKFARIDIEKVKNIAETLAAIVVILGIIAFFYEDYKTTQRDRFHATYDLYLMFQSNDFADVKYGLIKPWDQYNLQMLKNSKKSQAFIDKFTRDIVKKNQETFKSLYTLDQFVQGLETCINANVCDKQAAHDLFGRFIFDAYCLYKPAFPEVAERLQIKEFGQPIERFSQSMGGCL